MNIILFGFKGVGKTHFGKLLSLHLNRPFIDTDDLMGPLLSSREIYETLGEKGFRKMEEEIVETLASQSDSVIALGGGTVLSVSNVRLLQKIGRLIYLRSHFDPLKERILKNGPPSFIDPKNPIESLHQVYLERLPIYEAIQAESIDVDLLDEKAVLAKIIG